MSQPNDLTTRGLDDEAHPSLESGFPKQDFLDSASSFDTLLKGQLLDDVPLDNVDKGEIEFFKRMMREEAEPYFYSNEPRKQLIASSAKAIFEEFLEQQKSDLSVTELMAELEGFAQSSAIAENSASTSNPQDLLQAKQLLEGSGSSDPASASDNNKKLYLLSTLRRFVEEQLREEKTNKKIDPQEDLLAKAEIKQEAKTQAAKSTEEQMNSRENNGTSTIKDSLAWEDYYYGRHFYRDDRPYFPSFGCPPGKYILPPLPYLCANPLFFLMFMKSRISSLLYFVLLLGLCSLVGCLLYYFFGASRELFTFNSLTLGKSHLAPLFKGSSILHAWPQASTVALAFVASFTFLYSFLALYSLLPRASKHPQQGKFYQLRRSKLRKFLFLPALLLFIVSFYFSYQYPLLLGLTTVLALAELMPVAVESELAFVSLLFRREQAQQTKVKYEEQKTEEEAAPAQETQEPNKAEVLNSSQDLATRREENVQVPDQEVLTTSQPLEYKEVNLEAQELSATEQVSTPQEKSPLHEQALALDEEEEELLTLAVEKDSSEKESSERKSEHYKAPLLPTFEEELLFLQVQIPEAPFITRHASLLIFIFIFTITLIIRGW